MMTEVLFLGEQSIHKQIPVIEWLDKALFLIMCKVGIDIEVLNVS